MVTINKRLDFCLNFIKAFQDYNVANDIDSKNIVVDFTINCKLFGIILYNHVLDYCVTISFDTELNTVYVTTGKTVDVKIIDDPRHLIINSIGFYRIMQDDGETDESFIYAMVKDISSYMQTGQDIMSSDEKPENQD